MCEHCTRPISSVYGKPMRDYASEKEAFRIAPEPRILRACEEPEGGDYLLRINFCPMCGRDLRERG